ncbi:ferrochelatase [Vannielia sp.]|uniref:ferrochelatase n=1 Tax=Vannielia sp. TaxID=2813045 RepID=UPI00262C5788|nr:ferrochelatase [Vannielia sp.]MDF1872787.1 ferrochelatase [Vannielia sp.]
MTSTLPADHPAVKPRKIGVLIANLGTPDSTGYWDMRRYLGEFLSDKRVIDYPAWKWQPILQGIILTKRPFSSGKAYASIWDTERDMSPLMVITMAQTEALRARVQQDFGDEVMVDFCMRYGNPSTHSKVRAMVEAGCDRILFFPLYPQYAGATSGTANDQFFRALMEEKWQPASRTAPAYFDRPSYIDALAKSVEESCADGKPDLLLCSFHGMPKRYLMEGDPYHCQCQKTTRLLRERLGWPEEQIATTFQSQFGPEDWLRPYTVEEVAVRAKAGVKNIAVIAPAFSADCIETLEEINEEIKDSFTEAGGERFTYIPCLNDRPDHIEALAEVVRENLAGWIDIG